MTLENLVVGTINSNEVTVTFKKGNTWCTVSRKEIRKIEQEFNNCTYRFYKNQGEVLRGEETELKLDICKCMRAFEWIKSYWCPNIDFYALSVYYEMKKCKVKKIVPEGNYNLYVELE